MIFSKTKQKHNRIVIENFKNKTKTQPNAWRVTNDNTAIEKFKTKLKLADGSAAIEQSETKFIIIYDWRLTDGNAAIENFNTQLKFTVGSEKKNKRLEAHQ